MGNLEQQERDAEYWGAFDAVSEAYAATKADCDEFARGEYEAEEDA